MLLQAPALVRPNFETRTADLRAGEYLLDPAHSFLLFKIGHLELATYVGRFNRFDATLDFDSKNPSNSRLDAVVYLESLDINDPELEQTLSGSKWLDSKEFPEARFKTQSIVLPDSSASETTRPLLAITGDLTFRGVTHPIVLEGYFNGGADNLLTGKYTLGFTARANFSRSLFGMTDFSGLIGDKVEIEVFAEFQRLDK